MRVCLISSYPPNKARLSEYAYELSKELDARDEIEDVIILADKARPLVSRQGRKTTIYRVWKPGNPLSILGIMLQLLSLRSYVVHFNIHFFSMGNNRAENLVGLCLIPLCRLFGFKVVTTFHHLGIQNRELGELGIENSFLNKVGLYLGYSLVFTSNNVVSHVKNQIRKPKKFVYIPHGTIAREEKVSDANCDFTIVFFGALGPYKGVEYLIEAFQKLDYPNLRLIITDSPHPRFPNYSKKLRKMARNNHNIRFVDYIHEDDLLSFFSIGNIIVFPYVANTGTSGAFHTAASFGKATIMSDLPIFRELVDEGAGGLLFPPKDVDALAKCLRRLISNPTLIQRIGTRNLAFAKSRTWKIVARKYVQVYAKSRAR